MTLPWDVALEESVGDLAERAEEVAPSLLEHYCSMKLDAEPNEEIHTGLLCDLGGLELEPASIRRLLTAGLTLARLNLRAVDPHARTPLVQTIRRAVLDYSAELGFVYPLCVLLEVRGPDITIGGLAAAPLSLDTDSTVRLTTNAAWRDCGTRNNLYVDWDRLLDLQEGDVLFLKASGSRDVEVVVSAVGDESVECLVRHGGDVQPNAGVRVGEVPRDVERVDASSASLSSDTSDLSVDRLDYQLGWAVANDVDAVLSPVQSANDVYRLRAALGDDGSHVLLIAMIETAAAVDAVDEILEAADGLYLDRSVLSVDLSVEKIFIAQKSLVARCVKRGKPCIYRSVINEQIPTLCVGDLATLVMDGVDSIALEMRYELVSGWSGAGESAARAMEQCLTAACVVCRQAERVEYKAHLYGNIELMQRPLDEPSRGVCVCAAELALRARASFIVCLSTSGRSAKLLAHARPPCVVVVVTRACRVARQLRLWRGLRPLHYTEPARRDWECDRSLRVRAALRFLAAHASLRAGQAYVVTSSSRKDVGFTDQVQLAYVTQGEAMLDE